MKVLLLAPPNWVGDKAPIGWFNVSAVPLGLCYMAAVLESDGFRPSILDMNAPSIEKGELEKRLTQIKPDIVGISSMTSNYPNAVTIAKTIKHWNFETVVVMGGVHPTFTHKEVLQSVPEVDVVVRYEGELTLSELVQAVEKGGSLKGIKGISFREEGNFISTAFRERIQDLDSLPYPAYHLLEPSVEEYFASFGKRTLPMITTRGCPFGCIYCSTMAFNGRKYRTRSITNVMNEIEYLTEKFKVNDITFVDDNFTVQNDRVLKLCEEIRKRNISIKWSCSTRVDQVSEELLKEMKSSGCRDLFFGIESASQRVLDLAKKRFKIRRAKKAVKTAEKIGIKTHCSFIIGLPGESPRSLKNMMRFVEETKPSGRVLPNFLDILPGTELFERTQEYFSNQPSISEADITKVQLEIVTAFYKYNFGVNELFRVAPPDIIIV